MRPFLILTLFDAGCAEGLASGAWPVSSVELLVYTCPAAAEGCFYPLNWAVTMTAPFCYTLRLVGPGDQSEKSQEEDEDGLELESDKDHSKLHIARSPPGTEDGRPAARPPGATMGPSTRLSHVPP